MERNVLEAKTKEELLSLAKQNNITGRHKMRKSELIDALVALNKDEKKKYVENAKIGTIIAFKVNDTKVISGKIEEITKTGFVVKTKNGVRFMVRKKNVIWVKTGQRWPKGVYLALKGVVDSNEYRRNN